MVCDNVFFVTIQNHGSSLVTSLKTIERIRSRMYIFFIMKLILSLVLQGIGRCSVKYRVSIRIKRFVARKRVYSCLTLLASKIRPPPASNVSPSFIQSALFLRKKANFMTMLIFDLRRKG